MLWACRRDSSSPSSHSPAVIIVESDRNRRARRVPTKNRFSRKLILSKTAWARVPAPGKFHLARSTLHVTTRVVYTRRFFCPYFTFDHVSRASFNTRYTVDSDERCTWMNSTGPVKRRRETRSSFEKKKKHSALTVAYTSILEYSPHFSVKNKGGSKNRFYKPNVI